MGVHKIKRGPSTEPWGTPHERGAVEDCEGLEWSPHEKGIRANQTQRMEMENRASKASGAKRADFLFYKKIKIKNTHIL